MTSAPSFRALSPLAKAYVTVIVLLGAVTVIESTYSLYTEPIGWSWTVLALLTLVSGSATVRLPSLPATISVSETFVFTSVLLFGPAAGTLTVALDAFVISFWSSYRRGQPSYKFVFNVCALPLTIWLAAHLFFLAAHVAPLVRGTEAVRLNDILWPLFLFTIAYFALNSWIIAFAISLERHLSSFRVWKDNFVWLSLNYFGGASVAALLVTYTRGVNYTYLAVIIPLLVVLYFTFSTSMGRVEDANKHLTQLNSLYMSTIETLAMAIDAKDQITHGHIRRVQTYAVRLAREMGVTDESLIKAIEASALLHDMGKLAVPEYILNKPGPLTPAEFEKMKLHASVGADILSAIDFPYPVVPIVRHHHENWDGTGYPAGIAGSEIPLGARILSVVDCFDALTSDRPYRPRLADKDAIKILLDRRGKMYDPLVVDTFISTHGLMAPIVVADNPSLAAITDASQDSQLPPSQVHRFDEIAASTEEMLTLFDLARGLSGQMSLHDVSDVISKHLRRLIPCSLIALYAYDVEADELVAGYVAGDNASLLTGLRIGIGQRLSGWVAAHRQAIRNSDPVLDLGESARAMKPRPRSCLSVPLLIEKELVGVLTLYSTNRESFTEEHQRIIEVVAGQVSGIIRTAMAFDRNRATVLTDPVTGLPTLDHLRQLLGSHGGSKLPEQTSIIVVQFEGQSLAETQVRSPEENVSDFAASIRQSLRPADLLFRRGPDSFICLLFQTPRQITEHLARQVEQTLSSRLLNLGGRVWTAVAATSTDGDSIEMLIEAADARITKEAGPSLPNGSRPTGPSGESIH
jgi:putative nucleotidyltransferase with HDIG domain